MARDRVGAKDLPHASDLLILTASFGLLTGLVEGTALLLLQDSRWAGETINTLLVPRGILYISPIADLVLFVILGFLAAGLCRISRGLLPAQFILLLIFMATGFDWLALGLDRVMNPPAIAVLTAGLSMVFLRIFWKRRAQLVGAARRALPVLAAIVVMLAAGVQLVNRRVAKAAEAGLPPAPEGGANVLVVVMDTVRADHLSSLGYARATTPNLDRLAAQGVLFENAFSTSSWTLPAHASLLTGRYPFEHGAEVKAYDGRYPTLAGAFESRGYRTGAFSANTYYFARQNGFDRGFLHFDGTFSNLSDAFMRTLYGRNLMIVYEAAVHADLPGRKRADLVNARFLAWLGQDSSRPFFAVLNYFDAHDPYLPPRPFRGRFAGRQDVGGVLNGWGMREVLERPSDVRDERAAYDGGIAYEDDRIGKLMGELRTRCLAENTLVVVVSDHGEFFGEHGLYLHKNALFLEGIHVPLLMVWPGHLPAGARIETPVTIARVPATVMGLMPGRGRQDFPGPSLEPLWRQSAAAEASPWILSELVANTPPPGGGAPLRTESLLDARWHFIYSRGTAPQLYEWRKDLHEQNNLAGTGQGQHVVSAMMSCLQDHLSRIRQAQCGFVAGVLDADPGWPRGGSPEAGGDSAAGAPAGDVGLDPRQP
ncbi:MAG TPA: sulfatase [Candidatus Binatia bacterium]|nr:sulfatase [Candidatus Binatia bacterium]